RPDLHVTHLGATLDQVSYEHDSTHNVWRVRVTLPEGMISDGVQTCVISDASGVTIGSFAIICGAPLADDLRAEISLLRSELEVLQKAFRKHCAKNE
ncbi:MAG: hypothetical protein AAFX89_07445, partial [Pseudomonadota bacterium]